MFSGQTIAALITAAALAFIIPIGAVIVFKVKNRGVWLPAALVGAGTFIVFAMILERILHAVMLPVVQGSTVGYILYGALAAGIFEETGRYIAYKLVMKNHLTAKNAVMMGLGHGGFEAMYLVGFTFISYAGCAIMVNSQGLESVIALLSSGNADLVETIRLQLQGITKIGFSDIMLTIYERIVAMTFHVCMSVVVYHSVTQLGKKWLFPAAILLHALLDVPAAMYQRGVITSIPVVYALMTVFTVIVVGCTIVMTKKFSEYQDG